MRQSRLYDIIYAASAKMRPETRRPRPAFAPVIAEPSLSALVVAAALAPAPAVALLEVVVEAVLRPEASPPEARVEALAAVEPAAEEADEPPAAAAEEPPLKPEPLLALLPELLELLQSVVVPA